MSSTTGPGAESNRGSSANVGGSAGMGSMAKRSGIQPPVDLAAEVMARSEFAALGRPFKACPLKDLTEAEM